MAVSTKGSVLVVLIVVSMATSFCISQAQDGGSELDPNVSSLGPIESSGVAETNYLSDSDSLAEEIEKDNNFMVGDSPPRLRNIGYLYSGYNILEGNPVQKGSVDPGIRGYQIFQTTYGGNNTSPDGTFAIPDGSNIRHTQSCTVSFKSKELTTEKSYEESMKTAVEASAGYGGFAFKASTEYQTRTEEIRKGKSVFIRTESTCSIYKGTIDQTRPPKLHESFSTAVIMLGHHLVKNKLKDSHLVNFVERYGTHFITDALFGAKFGMEYQFSSDSYKIMKEKGLKISVSAEYAGLFTAGVSASTEKNRKDAETFQKESKNKFIYSYGSPIPSDGNELTWASAAAKDPLPIKVWIKEIHHLINNNHLNVSDETLSHRNIKRLRHAVKDFVEKKYCSILQKKGKVVDCSRIKDPWVKLNEQKVCFGATGRNPGSFYITKAYEITGVKLVHLSGKVSCASNKVDTLSNWGCGSYPGIGESGLNVFMKFPHGTSFFFPDMKQRDFQWYPHDTEFRAGRWYKLKGFNSNSDSLEFHIKGDVPHWLPKDKEIQIWYGEDLFNWYSSDNGGTVCVNVFGRLSS